jgi:hypothetical protein
MYYLKNKYLKLMLPRWLFMYESYTVSITPFFINIRFKINWYLLISWRIQYSNKTYFNDNVHRFCCFYFHLRTMSHFVYCKLLFVAMQQTSISFQRTNAFFVINRLILNFKMHLVVTYVVKIEAIKSVVRIAKVVPQSVPL